MTTIPAAPAADSPNPSDPKNDSTAAPAQPAPAAPSPEGQQPDPGQPSQDFTVIDGVEVPNDLSKVADPDMVDYYKALQEKAGQAPEQPEGKTGAEPAAPAAPSTAQPEPAAVATVPVAALQDERSKRQAAEQQAAYLKGQLDALQTKPAATPAADPAPAAATPSPDERIKTARSEIANLAKQFDNGDITLAKYEELKATHEDAIEAARADKLAARLKPAPQGQPVDADQITDQVRAQLERDANASTLEKAHPFVAVVFPEKMPTDQATADLLLARQNMIKSEAAAAARAEDPNIQAGTVAADKLFQKHIARLTDVYGPTWFPNHKPAAKPGTQPAPAAPSNGGPKPLSPQGQNRLEKLVTQAQQPPDPTAVGRAGGDNVYTDEAINRMSDDELARLPEHVKRARGLPV